MKYIFKSKFEMSLGSLFTIYKHFGGFCQVHFFFDVFAVANCMTITLYLFVGLLYLSLNFCVSKSLKMRCHLGSGRKTVNSKGHSAFAGANQNTRKLLFRDLINTKLY